ncbi:MAG: prolipoprotein diacylglyceryl transferase [Eubacteriales bacterium]|nr:prolipoprotein diacylglyceryl transferase [Eubacteriales bacterium]
MLPEIKIGRYALPSYGIAIYLGLLCLALISYREAKKRKINGEDLIYSLVLALLAAGLGAKLLYLITVLPSIPWSKLSAAEINLALYDLLRSGFVVYGALFAGFLSLWAYAKKYRLNSYKLLASIAVGLPFAQACGRIGCFLAGCCYGYPYSGPLALSFPQSSLHPLPVPRFPTQLVWALGNFLFGSFLLFYSHHLGRRASSAKQVFTAYLLGYSLLRFCGEFLRGDLIRGVYGPLSQAQWISIFVFGFGLVLLITNKFKRKKSKKG